MLQRSGHHPDRQAVLVQHRRRLVSTRPPSSTGWPTGQRDGAEAGVDRDQQALRPGLVPAVHLVQRADLPGRDAEFRQALHQLVAPVATEGGVDRGDHRVPVGHPIGVAFPLRPAQSERGGKALPEPVAADRDLHRSVGGMEQPVRADRGMVRRRPSRAPRRPQCTGCPGRRARRPCRPAARCGPPCRARCVPARAAQTPHRTRRTCRPAGRRSAPRPWSARPGGCRSATSGRPRPGRSGRSRPGRPPGRRGRTR